MVSIIRFNIESRHNQTQYSGKEQNLQRFYLLFDGSWRAENEKKKE